MRRVAEAGDFTFTSDDAQVTANEAGHIATLTNQLKGVLLEVRMLAFGFQRDINTDLRKCPHCSAVWAKEEGCDGNTTCGNRVGQILDTRFESLSQFSFRFDGERLHITQAAKRKLMGCQSSGRAGCGKTIASQLFERCRECQAVKPQESLSLGKLLSSDVRPLH